MARNHIVGKNTRPRSNKATGRDYAYDKAYQKKRRQIKNRVARNKARRLMIKKYGKSALKGKDVDHKKPLAKGGSMSVSNLRVIKSSTNRALGGALTKGRRHR